MPTPTAQSVLAVEIAALARWWWEEIEEGVRAVLSRLAPRIFNDAVLCLSASGGTLVVHSRGKPQSWTLSAAPDDSWVLDGVMGKVPSPIEGSRVRVALPDDGALVHDLALPATAESELQSAVELHVERILPLPLEDLAIHCEVVERQRALGRITVRVWVVRREHVRAVRNRSVELGLRPVRIGVASGSGGVIGNFLNDDRPRFGHPGRLNRRLLISFGSLTLVVLGLWASQWLYERAEVERELKILEPQAAAARDLQREIERRRPLFDELSALVRQPDGVDALIALTAAVPDESWVQNLLIQSPRGEPTELRWMAYAVDSGVLIEAVDRSSHLTDVALVSTLSREGERERLELTARVPLESGSSSLPQGHP